MTMKSPRAGLDGKRILVAEDEFFIADDLQRALRRLGAEVVGPVSDYDAAMAVAAGDRPIDAAVLDINLQGRNTVGIADLLRRRGISLVFASGYDQSYLPRHLLDVPYWNKPFSAEALCAGLGVLGQS